MYWIRSITGLWYTDDNLYQVKKHKRGDVSLYVLDTFVGEYTEPYAHFKTIKEAKRAAYLDYMYPEIM